MGGLEEGFGSGFGVSREVAFWGVFEATAAFFRPLLAGLQTCIGDYGTNS